MFATSIGDLVMCACGNTEANPAVQFQGAGVRFRVADMTCAHCAGTIRNALREGMPGAAFDVDLENQVVTVAGDAGQAEAILRDAGYEPKLLVH